MSSFKTNVILRSTFSSPPNSYVLVAFHIVRLYNIKQGFDRSVFGDIAKSSNSMKDLTIVKIVVLHRQTDLSTLGNNVFLLSNDKEVAQHIIPCCIWVPLCIGTYYRR